MDKKKVAFFGIKYFPSQGGSSRVAESIARELLEKYDITVYCYKNSKAKAHLENVSVVQIPNLPLKEVGVFLYYFLCCIHILFSKKYDLIHVHKTDSAFFIPLLRLKTKVIATSQEAPYLRDKWNWIGKAYLRLMEFFFIYSSSIRTSVSKPLAKIYQKKYGKPVYYIPNGVTIEGPENDDASIHKHLSEHGIAEGEEFILFAARRIMFTKGCHTFLNAMHQLKYKGRILIAGEEDHARSYMKKITQLADGLNVSFLGYIDSKAVLMSLVDKARWFVFPSLTEGLSLMLLEVGSRGNTPILCSDIPENTAVFDDNEALFFETENSNDLAEKFNYGNTNYSNALNRAKIASQRVKVGFSSTVIADQYDALYCQLLDTEYKRDIPHEAGV